MNVREMSRKVWWFILLGVLTAFVYQRRTAFSLGTATPADVALLIVWILLWLLPLGKEVSVFGVTLKKHIEDVRRDLSSEIAGLRAFIQSNVTVNTSFNPMVGIPQPPRDSEIPEIKRQVEEAVRRTLEAYSFRPRHVEPGLLGASDTTLYLFSVRHSLDREIKRIWLRTHEPTPELRLRSPARMLFSLGDQRVLAPELLGAIREVYSVCSAAIHGEDVSAAQVAFVREVGPNLLAALRAIE